MKKLSILAFLFILPTLAMADAVSVTVDVESYEGQAEFYSFAVNSGLVIIGAGTLLFLLRGIWLFDVKMLVATAVGVLMVIAFMTTITTAAPVMIGLDKDSCYGDLRLCDSDGNGDCGPQAKWDISSIPDNADILDAWACYYNWEQYGTPDTDVTFYRVDDQAYVIDNLNAAGVNAQTITNNTALVWNTTPTVSTWGCINVTVAIKTDYDAGYDNSSWRFWDPDQPMGTVTGVSSTGELTFGNYNGGAGPYFKIDSKEAGGGGPGQYVYLDITYEPAPPPADPLKITYDGVTQYNVSDSSRYTGEFINFQANITEEADSPIEVIFYHNGTSYNLTGTNTSYIYQQALDLPAGTHNITWYATNYTYTDSAEFIYTVLKATTLLNITVNGERGYYYGADNDYFNVTAGQDVPVSFYLAESGYNVGDRGYVFGGLTGGQPSNKTKIYNITSNTWSYGADFPTDIRESGGGEIGDSIYILGGRNGTAARSDTIYRYNTTSDTFTLMSAKLPEQKDGMTNGCPYNDRYIYQFGGKDELGQSTNTVYKYDSVGQVVTNGTFLPFDLRDHAAICVGDQAYLFGGYRDGIGNWNTSLRYNMSDDTITQLTVLPDFRREVSGGYIDGEIFILGGQNNTASEITEILVYNIAGDSYHFLTGASLIQSARLASAFTYEAGNAIILTGGFAFGGEIDDTQILNKTLVEPTYQTLNNGAANVTVWNNVTGLTVGFDINFTGWSPSSGTSPYENTTESISQSDGDIINVTAYGYGNQNYTTPESITYFAQMDVAAESYLSATFNYSSVSFGSLSAGSNNNSAIGGYSVSVNASGNYKVEAYGSNLLNGTYNVPIANLLMDTDGTTPSLASSIALSTSNQTIDTGLSDLTNYHGFWLSIPSGQRAGHYTTTLTITYSLVV